MSYTYEHPRPAVAVDCVVFGIDLDDLDAPLKVLLIKRGDEPFKDRWALPGGHVHTGDELGEQGESLEAAARRELQEETTVELVHLEQLYTFGAPDRDPRYRVISVAYYGLVRSEYIRVKGGSDASLAEWVSVKVGMGLPLAFDHDAILRVALERLRGKARYAPLGFYLLPIRFSLPELQRLYEAILGKKLNGPNFRKKILAMKILTGAGREKDMGKPGPKAQLYRFDKRAYDKAVALGWNFEV